MRAAVGTTAMLLWVSAVSAQDKPNFAGKWEPDAAKNEAAGGGGGGARGGGGRGGMGLGPITVAVDAAGLSVTRETQNGPVTTVYKLDGSETAITMGQMEAKATAKWDGAKIVIVQKVQTPNGERVSTIEYSMEGSNLVIATTQPPRGGGEPVTSKRYFCKAG
ncbi:MAG: hypothetical protein ACRENP_13920 [Longimicrobiales bacterium]